MSQTPTMSMQGNRTGDGPDLLFVLRHYVWLIVIGTLLCAGVSYGLYWSFRQWAPKYRAEARFLVSGQAASPLDKEGKPNQEEISSFISTQVSLIKTREFYDVVFKTDTVLKSKWYAKAKTTSVAMQLLNESLMAAPVQKTSLFVVSLTIAEDDEVHTILNEICVQYQAWLDNLAAAQRDKEIRAYRDQLTSAEKNYNRAQADLEEFRSLKDVGAMNKAMDIASMLLSDMERDLAKLTADHNMMQAAVDAVTLEQAKPDWKPSNDMLQEIERDPIFRNLDDQRMALEREINVTINQFGKDYPAVRTLTLRLNEVKAQLEGVRVIATQRAKERQLSSVTSALSAIDGRIRDTKKKHDEKQNEIRRLDTDLLGYRVRELAVQAAREELTRAQQEYNRQDSIIRTAQSRVQFVARAQKPDEIASPTLMGYLPAGFLVGLLLSFALAYLLELTNKRVRTPRDITRTMQLPLLGFVPDQMDDDMLHGDISTSIRTAPSSMIAESFRQIRGRIAAHADGSTLRTVLVASISPDGGATTVASNLANGLALNGRRVLLVDANFYRPGLRTIYPNMAAVGLSDLLGDPDKADDTAIVPAADLPNLFLMSAGTKTTGSSELLDTHTCTDLLARLKDNFDVVIFDGAPLSLVSDSVSLASKVDGVVAVVRAGRITRGTVARVRDQLKQVRANLLGVVLNAAQAQSAGYFRENYRTFYRYANGSIGGTNGHAQTGRQTTSA